MSGRFGGRRTAARASRRKSVTPVIRRFRRGSARSASACEGDAMTTETAPSTTGAARGLELAEHVLDLVGRRAADAEVEVTVRQGHEALTRFATGFIHQNVASDVNHVLIRVAL